MNIIKQGKKLCVFCGAFLSLVMLLTMGGLLGAHVANAVGYDFQELASNETESTGNSRSYGRGQMHPDGPPSFEELDQDGDGYLTEEELPPPPRHGNRRGANREDNDEMGSSQENQGQNRASRQNRGGRSNARGRGSRGEGENVEEQQGASNRHFDAMDADGDGLISEQEFVNFHEERAGLSGGGRGQGPTREFSESR